MIDNSHNINIYLSTLSADNSSQMTLTFNNNSSKHQWLECVGTQENDVPAPLITGK